LTTSDDDGDPEKKEKKNFFDFDFKKLTNFARRRRGQGPVHTFSSGRVAFCARLFPVRSFSRAQKRVYTWSREG